jgi:hypothetical protein
VPDRLKRPAAAPGAPAKPRHLARKAGRGFKPHKLRGHRSHNTASLAAASYSFYLQSPAVTCQNVFRNDPRYYGFSRLVSVATPTAYAVEEPGQWLYWRAWVFDWATGQIVNSGDVSAFQGAWATTTTPAAFPLRQDFYVANLSTRGPVGVGIEVWWNSPRSGWRYSWRTYLPITHIPGSYVNTSC